MATKCAVVSKPCLEHGLLLPPQHEDLLQLALIPSPDLLQQTSLHCKPLIRGLQSDKGGSTNIAGTNLFVQINNIL